jgi:hypothetical protein
MKNNKLTLSELRNVIKEEVQFQLTKKNLVESLDSKTLKRILNESVVSRVTMDGQTVNPNTTEPFRIINPNPNDKVTTKVVDVDTDVVSSTGIKSKTYVKFKYIYNLQATTDSPEYKEFFEVRKSNSSKINFFSTDKSSHIIVNHDETLKRLGLKSKYPNFSYTLDLEITHSSNVKINLDGVKGQKVIQ